MDPKAFSKLTCFDRCFRMSASFVVAISMRAGGAGAAVSTSFCTLDSAKGTATAGIEVSNLLQLIAETSTDDEDSKELAEVSGIDGCRCSDVGIR
jgi:hypothetical protein